MVVSMLASLVLEAQGPSHWLLLFFPPVKPWFYSGLFRWVCKRTASVNLASIVRAEEWCPSSSHSWFFLWCISGFLALWRFYHKKKKTTTLQWTMDSGRSAPCTVCHLSVQGELEFVARDAIMLRAESLNSPVRATRLTDNLPEMLSESWCSKSLV